MKLGGGGIEKSSADEDKTTKESIMGYQPLHFMNICKS